jgi:hypothetical protein
MEEVLGYAILLSPALLLPALLVRRWSLRRTLAYLGLMTGVLTGVYSAIDWGGPGDQRMTQGIVILYGIAVSGAALAIAGLMFIINPPRPVDEADRG